MEQVLRPATSISSGHHKCMVPYYTFLLVTPQKENHSYSTATDGKFLIRVFLIALLSK